MRRESLVVWALGGLLLPGCALGGQREDRLFDELQKSHARAAESQAKLGVLESRLAAMEQQTAVRDARPATPPRDPEMLARLDELIALNHEMLAASAAAMPANTQEAVPARPPGAPQQAARAASDGCDPNMSQEEQLRRLVLRLHGTGSGFRGGLSREQAEALHVLLRRERVLDSSNPWRSW